MLKGIFGNATAEKVLLHIHRYGSIYSAAIAKDYGISASPIINQLERFEKASILVSKMVGKTKMYSFNSKSPFTKNIRELVRIAYEAIPLNEREMLFKPRPRPKAKESL
jgi:predicted transcriptional regulator